MTTAYLKSYGPNNMVIISMIFESFVDGMKFLNSVTPAVKGEWQVKDMEDGTRSGYHEDKWMDDETIWEPFFNAIYTTWYFGCGGPGPIVLRELPERTNPFVHKPLCGFDLD